MSLTLAQGRRRPRLTARSLSRTIEPWLYLSPALVILFAVLLIPLVVGIGYSFRRFSAFRSEYVGLDQYRAMLQDPALGQALFNTVWWTAGSLVFQSSLPTPPVTTARQPGLFATPVSRSVTVAHSPASSI